MLNRALLEKLEVMISSVLPAQEQSIGPLISPEMKKLRVKAKGSLVTVRG